jgi:alkylation response protein AidB-like acyl-CoA dehydrogenase
MTSLQFEPTDLSADERALQLEVRDFLRAELKRGSFEPGLGFNATKDAAFSAKLAARGWVGMALPRRYGGGDRSAVERFIVVEELLRWGAPVGHHWVADRQTGPIIARFGSEALKERFLPAICRGEIAFSIGMSEPDSGSDLASITTRAARVEDGWTLQGTKVWTTGAHVHDWIVVLCRTTPLEDLSDKHAGLSQMIVDLRSDRVHARPIPFIDTTLDFCEVLLDDVFVPDDLVLGQIGQGWAQNTSELALERGGPDRWLSTYLVVEELVRETNASEISEPMLDALGTAAASFWALHHMSLAIARSIDHGGMPIVESALVKELGTRFEQDVVNAIVELIDFEPRVPGRSLFQQLLVTATLTAPSFTIRGGTNEILRGVAARGLRPRSRA